MFETPANLLESPTSEHRAWVVDLAATVAAVADRWSLRLGPPYQPGGTAAWVAPAWDANGSDVVVKVGWTHDEARDEAAGLAFWAGEGTVRLLAAESFGPSTTALLLERCVPGTRLKAVLPEPEHDVVVAGLLRRLWREPPQDSPFRTLASMCADWADGFETELRQAAFDHGLVRAGIELLRSLPATADRTVVLGTDLHADNILAAEREPWLVVDPKPYVGDPTYDATQHLLNCERLLTEPVALARRMADLLDLDPDRLLHWLFARCATESIINVSLRPVASLLSSAVP